MVIEPGASDERLDPDALLRIDIAAELRKLAEAQLQGSWQLPVELVRRAIRGGATAVDVRFRRDRFEVGATSDRCASAVTWAISTILDDAAMASDAHDAVLTLEDCDEFGLLALRAVPADRVELVLPTVDGAVMHVVASRGSVTAREHAPPRPGGSSVTVHGGGVDVRRARRELAIAGRFSPVPITVDGAPLPAGFPGAFMVETLPPDAGVVGRVAFSFDGEAPVLWVLRHGIVATHLTLTAGPAFEAAIEIGASIAARATSEDLRAYTESLAPALLTAVVDQLDLESRRPGGGRGRGARIAELALQSAKLRALAPRVARMPLFDVLDDGLPTGRVALVDLRAAARLERGRTVVDALRPDDDPREFECRGRVFVLDDRLRSWLMDSLQISTVTPTRHARRGLLARMRDGLGSFGRALTALTPGVPEIPQERWTAAEVGLVSAIGSLLPEGRSTTMTTGSRTRWRRGVLGLGRTDPLVIDALAVCERSPAWVYPAALALTGGELRVRDARRSWSVRAWARP